MTLWIISRFRRRRKARKAYIWSNHLESSLLQFERNVIGLLWKFHVTLPLESRGTSLLSEVVRSPRAASTPPSPMTGRSAIVSLHNNKNSEEMNWMEMKMWSFITLHFWNAILNKAHSKSHKKKWRCIRKKCVPRSHGYYWPLRPSYGSWRFYAIVRVTLYYCDWVRLVFYFEFVRDIEIPSFCDERNGSFVIGTVVMSGTDSLFITFWRNELAFERSLCTPST